MFGDNQTIAKLMKVIFLLGDQKANQIYNVNVDFNNEVIAWFKLKDLSHFQWKSAHAPK